MGTKKLYYKDSYIYSFKARLHKSGTDDKGRFYIVLDQTAFYPIGGGQPNDTGTLNNKPVIDVEEVDGEIRHYMVEPDLTETEYVGEINWDRRFDHMQQHAGQHILTAAFEEQFDYKTLSFHLGKEICSIDIEAADLKEKEANRVEEIANQIIVQNSPIETKWVTEKELDNYPLRKDISVSENIRLVIIPDFDYNGCGGTHPNTTGQVSMIKILHWERKKKNTRVYFACGNRVLAQLHEKEKVIQGLRKRFSVPQEKIMEATNKMHEKIKELESTVSDLNMKLLEYEAKEFIQHAQIFNNKKIVQSVFANRSKLDIQQLAKILVDKNSDILVLFVNETDDKLQLVGSRGEQWNLHMGQFVQQSLTIINGRGGGRENMAQGGGEKVISAENFIEKVMTMLEGYV
ncbi:alanyl-tRNA editing protein [Oceanobacillus senegalensis]|uniref:alanyl-tRNA editing protein n=1 Tax=Oceanobacillus senegalensis TaxID=1936063 RepID=UPI000A30969B|nr:DHHA1 domain-containing protein [Oceanobacillus senegalensis]